MVTWGRKKQCIGCGKEKSQRDFLYDCTMPDKLTAFCKTCLGHVDESSRAIYVFKNSQDWQTCLNYWCHSCAVCGRSACGDLIIVADHWIPKHAGGKTEITNIVPLCQYRKKAGAITACNPSKQNKPSFEWLLKRFSEEDAYRISLQIQTYFEWVLAQKTNSR